MKGISFCQPMVKAWFAGNKSVTRRLMNPQPETDRFSYGCIGGQGFGFIFGDKVFKPPYRPSETVYVKEAWRVGAWNEYDNTIAVDYKADGHSRKEWIFLGFTDEGERQFYKLWQQSTDDARKKYGIQEKYKWNPGESPCRWRSHRFMPEWASRGKILIGDVRPERVKEITVDEAISEGIEPKYCCDGTECGCMGRPIDNPVDEFQDLWETLHPGSWSLNPWVWRIELRRA